MKIKTRLMCLTGIFAAIIFVFTAYVHIPSHTGYTHVGDAFIYLAACMLPFPYAAVAAACGAVLADLLTGFAVWAPATLIIKVLTALFFSRRAKLFSTRNLLAILPASLLCIIGYYLYEAIIVGNLIAPLGGVPGYIIQSILSGVLFSILALIFDKIKLTDQIFKDIYK